MLLVFKSLNPGAKKDREKVRSRSLSGIRESDPPPWLGKPMHYRCANPALRYKYNDSIGYRKKLCTFETTEKEHAMRFLLINQPMFNRGDESAHKALVYALLQHFPDCSIEVLFTGRPQEAVEECRVDDPRMLYTNLPVDERYLNSYLRRLERNTRFLWYFNPIARDIARRCRKADWIISSPGDNSLGARYDWDHLFFATIAEYAGRHLAYYGRSIGPFPDDSTSHKRFNLLSRRVLKRADFVSLRDPESCRIAGAMGVQYFPTLDTSFLYTPMVQLPQEVNDALGEGEYIVLVPNYLIPEAKDFNGRSTPLQVKLFFAELSRRILDQFPDCRIAMLPQLFCGRDYASTDYAFFKDIAEDVADSRVVVLPDTLPSECHQAIIAGSKCVVGARYHSIVFAINNNVPFVTLNYERRILGMLETLGKQDRVVDITLALEPPRGRRPAAESRIGASASGALTFEAEVAIARILDRMQRLAPDEEARRKAKNATTECFERLVSMIRKSTKGMRRAVSTLS